MKRQYQSLQQQTSLSFFLLPNLLLILSRAFRDCRSRSKLQVQVQKKMWRQRLNSVALLQRQIKTEGNYLLQSGCFHCETASRLRSYKRKVLDVRCMSVIANTSFQVDANLSFAASTHKGVNQRSKQTQQQRPESPTVTLTWHACKY